MTVVRSLRNPEYTGENRCGPCTIVNVLIALGVSALIGTVLAWTWTAAVGVLAGALVLGLSSCLIWLRGYLVPGTPTLTKRYLPRRMLSWFGKDPLENVAVPDEIDPEATLLEAGVLEPCAEVDDLCLTAAFDREWRTELEAVEEEPDPAALLDQLGIESDDVEVERYDDAVAVKRDGRRIGQWPSATALRLDTAASGPIADRVPYWRKLQPTSRSELVAGVRIFLEECPDGGPVEFATETRESCCSSYEVVSVVCAESGDRLLEQPVQ
ncbi:hypothetical protein [Natrialba swarupiae]|uniref:Uncharacterized protein n=1 Tax=Natrialba swarupiae TaxID=2448032 RepID=A0A5D5APH3_9EURY|nr:hypothetical protein [Natrialba swarupiae]TYT62964.1 hypothetical protein FYC77_04785 [Natrialba swarupiae]